MLDYVKLSVYLLSLIVVIIIIDVIHVLIIRGHDRSCIISWVWWSLTAIGIFINIYYPIKKKLNRRRHK